MDSSKLTTREMNETSSNLSGDPLSSCVILNSSYVGPEQTFQVLGKKL